MFIRPHNKTRVICVHVVLIKDLKRCFSTMRAATAPLVTVWGTKRSLGLHLNDNRTTELGPFANSNVVISSDQLYEYAKIPNNVCK